MINEHRNLSHDHAVWGTCGVTTYEYWERWMEHEVTKLLALPLRQSQNGRWISSSWWDCQRKENYW